MSAREPFVRYIEGADRLFINGVERTDPSDSAADTCAAINAAHADRVAAELEAAADDVERYAPDAMEMLGHHDGTLSNATRERIATWLYVRAKAIREGGGK